MKVEEIDVEEFLSFADTSRRKPTFNDLVGLVHDDSQITDLFIERLGEPNRRKIIAVIKLEPSLITGELIAVDDKCKNPRHCVVGALFYHAGVSNKRLRELQSRYGAGTEKLPMWAHEKLWKHYGLTPIHTNALMDGNDSDANFELFRDEDDEETCTVVNKAALIKEVESLGLVDENEVDDMLSYTKYKGAKEFLHPFLRQAYNEWINLGSKALIAQAKLVKQRLHLKAAKK